MTHPNVHIRLDNATASGVIRSSTGAYTSYM